MNWKFRVRIPGWPETCSFEEEGMLEKLFGSVPGFRFSGHAGIKESLQVLDICISYNYRGKYKKKYDYFLL